MLDVVVLEVTIETLMIDADREIILVARVGRKSRVMQLKAVARQPYVRESDRIGSGRTCLTAVAMLSPLLLLMEVGLIASVSDRFVCRILSINGLLDETVL